MFKFVSKIIPKILNKKIKSNNSRRNIYRYIPESDWNKNYNFLEKKLEKKKNIFWIVDYL